MKIAHILARILPLVLLCLVSCTSTPDGLVDGRLAPCPWTPNCTSSDGEGATSKPLEFEGDPVAALDSLIVFLREEDGAELVHREENYAHLLYRTRWLRFRDDVELRLSASEGVIHIRSASRLGLWDLGTNRRRVESVRERWIKGTSSSPRR